MAVTWTLKAADGSNLSHQPGTGSPLALKFTNAGDPHLNGYSSELIAVVEVAADTSTVTITLTPDNSGYTLDETASSATRVPSGHTGSFSWTDGADGLTTLVFGVPAIGTTWEWDFGQTEPAIALKMKAKVRRE